ncbi:MAG: bifunctional diaminohydroxyphosphoribosylaminopyrimidine deaminase/5-amino-6-(5-phosphoribosylamino)uracil reductase RibD [Bacteroidales bacterium]|jgi:diaminohydroxyphosphoribosylaminopyrimidine deaminase/5-amino-6-(5-phosphoribosylamino)uracil reductase
MMADDAKFMKRCIELAGKASGFTYPNPMVGSVIVHEGIVIGEGYHLKAGEPHAEEIAINSVTDRSILPSSVLYVSLEPCSHFGRRPPCADLIISSGIKKVIIGTMDTSINVSGKGIARLKGAGCEVKSGVMEQECRWLNRRFFTFHEKKRPYIILKWAQSADGYIDMERSRDSERKPNWITGKAERILVHKWRAEEQAVLVGAGTIRADNPELTVRDWGGNNPLRLVLSGSGNIGEYEPLFRTKGHNVVFTCDGSAHIKDSVIVKMNDEENAAIRIAEYLYNSGIQSVIVEGGAEVLGHFILKGLWDEARIFYGCDFFGKGISSPEIRGKFLTGDKFTSSTMNVIINEESQNTG